MSSIHHCSSFSENVDRADRVDGGVESAPCVEILLDGWQKIGSVDMLGLLDYEGVGESLVSGQTLRGIDGETLADELPRYASR